MAQTDKRAASTPPATSSIGRVDSGAAGFTLIEVVCVLAILALLAAIALPALPRSTSRPQLEAYAMQMATLLKADHNAAMRRRVDVATVVDASGRTVRSGITGRSVRVPEDVDLQAMLATRCNDRPSGPTIRHLASGMSCGGVIAVTRHGAGYQVRVNWLTGGVEVVPVN
jgi:general secretion pathway protein H